MSCYTGFFNVRRGWQSLNTGHRFYLRLIRRTGCLWIYTSRTTDGRPFKPKKLSVPFLYPGVSAGLAPFRGLVPLGRRNLVPILPPAHPLGRGSLEWRGRGDLLYTCKDIIQTCLWNGGGGITSYIHVRYTQTCRWNEEGGVISYINIKIYTDLPLKWRGGAISYKHEKVYTDVSLKWRGRGFLL